MKGVSFESMKKANAIVGDLLAVIGDEIVVGKTTAELDVWAESFIRDHGAEPAFKGMYGFPATLCISINSEIIHGIPSAMRRIADGDIVSIDVGARVKGCYGDAARTYPVGNVSESHLKLLTVTKESLVRGIAHARVGNHTGDIGHAIQDFVEKHGYNVIRDFVGHGIGRDLHAFPEVPNFGRPKSGPVLQEGMYLAIEPMVVTGSWRIKILEDEWTAVTLDGGYAAHFEDTVYISKDGPIILTECAHKGDYGKKQ